MVDAGCRRAVLEVSSHSLALERVHGLAVPRGRVHQPDPRPPRLPRRHGRATSRPSACCSTSLLREDGHADPQRSTTTAPTSCAAPAAGTVWTYSADRRRPPTSGARTLQLSLDGTRFRAQHAARAARRSRRALLGRFNVQNMLAASAPRLALGLPPEAVAPRDRARCAACPGGMERVAAGQPFTVLVDYAHTDDALKNLLETVRGLKPRRVITRVRLRRRPRPHQAPADGRGGRAALRPRRRSPPTTRAASRPRRSSTRSAAACPAAARPRTRS